MGATIGATTTIVHTGGRCTTADLGTTIAIVRIITTTTTITRATPITRVRITPGPVSRLPSGATGATDGAGIITTNYLLTS